MTWDAAQVNGVLDDVLVTVGIAVLIVRQFVWRSAEPARMLTMPALVIAVGMAYLVAELHDGFHWVGGDWVFVAELVLVAATGTAMGYVTHFRRAPRGLQYRLTGSGVALWALFLAVRIGSFALAEVLGADAGRAIGLVLLSFGINRLAAVLVVRRRAEALLAAGPHEGSGDAYARRGSDPRQEHHR